MNRLRLATPFALLYVPFIIMYVLSLGCATQFGDKLTMTAFMGSYEHGVTSEEGLCSPTGEKLVVPEDDLTIGDEPVRAICEKTTWHTFIRRPWGTSENTVTVTESIEVIGQTGKGLSDNMAGVAGEDIGGKALKAFTPGGAAGGLVETVVEGIGGEAVPAPGE